ncbi:MAG: beta-N-acetylhexosaminidase [Saprospiraceae bacterium]
MFFVRNILCFTTIYLLSSTLNGQSSIGETQNIGVIPHPNEMSFLGEVSDIRQMNIKPSQLISTYILQLFDSTKHITFDDLKKTNVSVELDQNLSKEAYDLNIGKNEIKIVGGSEVAIQYAFTSLEQMIRFHGLPLPMVNIKDEPAFIYRGMHLDVSRHFFTMDEVKKYIDYLAYYKYNHFHWHLTDDQGWRIEIKKYPKLQEIAAFRKETLLGHYSDKPHKYNGQRYGGFYTQEEIKEVVAYASSRNINVIPEIEMPGHALAALAAYPELGCSGGPYEVATKWGIFNDVFCPTEATFTFLENVVDEVLFLFPYKYIHIGGDECPKTSWEKSDICRNIMEANDIKDYHHLQSYFIGRMAKYIQSRGRQIIGWDEILEGGLADGATVMSWRGNQGGMEAARQGHDVIMTPGSHCYFDYYQSTAADEPIAIGGYTPLEKVYHWKVIPDALEPEKRAFILGGQANVWTEYIHDFKQVEYMAYARGFAMAEVLWTRQKDYVRFIDRFLHHQTNWKKRGSNVANHIFELKPNISAGNGKEVSISFNLHQGKEVWHEWNGKAEKGKTFFLTDEGKHHFTVDGDQELSKPWSMSYLPHLATKAKISINPEPSSKYPGNGKGSIINGVFGSDSKYGGLEWLGFEGKDVQILLEWKSSVSMDSILFRFYKGEGQWIYLPSNIKIFASKNGRVFEEIKTINQINSEGKVANVEVQAAMSDIRFLKIDVQNYGLIPKEAQGFGHRAWLFIDEIVVK